MPKIIKKVYIVHDYRSNSNDHWYPWLSREVKALGHQTKRVMLSNPLQPHLKEWQQNLAVQIPQLDQDTIVIAHGLSGLSVLAFIEQHYVKTNNTTGPVILVSGFDSPMVALSELNQIIRAVKLSYTQLQYAADRYVMFMSNNDPFVPATHSLRLAHSINAHIVEQKDAAHFRKADGFSEFPELLSTIKRYLTNEVQTAVSL